MPVDVEWKKLNKSLYHHLLIPLVRVYGKTFLELGKVKVMVVFYARRM